MTERAPETAQDLVDFDEAIETMRVFLNRARQAVEFLQSLPDDFEDPALPKAWASVQEIVGRLEVLIAYRQSLRLSPEQVQ